MLFGGALMMVAPLTAVLMLRQLHFQPWEYGLVLGLPCLGGALGAALARPLTRRYGARAVLLGSGVLRAPGSCSSRSLPPSRGRVASCRTSTPRPCSST